ncbi:hypothetical protein RU58_00047 [Achromobacter phage phiAxp-1]|uniref:hypothetical protein n=1 Tax=Achromobacter phage phiAxp-1 TaxID=1610509 RepID=UPI0006554C38|nr:hypothetical protein RU58_00047 [Achromobacter phage phiAxp-1]AKJ71372.1 hypothetical protein RU58_00047 [Achromobacter phage phiAxp-1]
MRNPTFTRLHATAQRMIAKNGANGQILRETVPPHKPGEMPPDPVLTTVYNGPICVLPNNSELRKAFDALAGNPTVQIGELVGYVSPKDGSIEFTISDTMKFGGRTYSVKNGINYNPDGLGNLLHILELQRLN